MFEGGEKRGMEVPGGHLGTVVLSGFPQLQTPLGNRVSTLIRQSPSMDPLEDEHAN